MARTIASLRRKLLGTRSRLGWVTVAMGCFGIAFGISDLLWLDIGQNGATHSWISRLTVVAGASMLMRRDAANLTTVGAIGLGTLIIALDGGTETPLSMSGVMALYLCARHNPLSSGLLAGAATAATAVSAVVIAGPDSVVVESGLEIFQATFITGAGVAMRVNAGRNERLIEVEAARLAQEERLRLAREVHDVIAQNLSSIAVQSGVASRLIDEDPAHAKVALDRINAAGRSSLDELRAFLGMLRSEDTIVPPTDPRAGVPEVGRLIEEMTDAGLCIDLRSTGDFPASADRAVRLTTFHILQEALLNVARHAGPAGTTINMVHTDYTVDLRVHNDPGQGPRQPVPSTGVGITGMRERAEAIGGTLQATTLAEGGFEVVASLPYTSSLTS